MRALRQIRDPYAPKFAGIEASAQIMELLECLLNENWTTPRIEDLSISPDHCVLAKSAGEASHKFFADAESDLLCNFHGTVAEAELDGDEVRHLPGKVAGIHSQPRI